MHFFVNCAITIYFCSSLGINSSSPVILISNSLWLIALRDINPSLHNSIAWGDIPFVIWNFWNNRNKNNENNTNISFSIIHVLRQVVEYNLLTTRESNLNRVIPVSIVWNNPSQGWYKLNTGGAFKENIFGRGA